MFRFSPQVIPFLLTVAALFYAGQGAFVSIVHLWYGDSYRQVEFVMDEWRPNDGYPYVAGHLAGTSDPSPFHLVGAVVDGKRVLAKAPSLPFEAGSVVKVWFSPDAPFTTYNDESANAIPVEAMPSRPGWGRLAASLAMMLAIAVVGFLVTGWVAKRWARQVQVT